MALFMAMVIFPGVVERGYVVPDNFVHYALVLLGEVLIGLILGFFLVVIYDIFQVAGQFFSLQMGFGASEVFDPLAQVEIPLIGQFLNLIAMLVFVVIGGFQKFFLAGIDASFRSITAMDLASSQGRLLATFAGSLGQLFESALTISFPILGTLFLVSLSMGLMAKAAPQMNLLMMGFPLAIGVAFIIMLAIMPFLMEAFAAIIETSFKMISRLILEIKGDQI